MLILFVGSVFSPYYAWRNWETPDDHCALNVALYGEKRGWSMTERKSKSSPREENIFQIGPSRVSSKAQTLRFDIHERGMPIPRALKGEVIVKFPYLNSTEYQLDHNREHFWRPMCTHLHVEVRFKTPRLSWKGTGYLDMNHGSHPIEKGFDYWDWSRVPTADGKTYIRYVTDPASGPQRLLNLSLDQYGKLSPGKDTDHVHLPRTSLWQIERRTGLFLGQKPQLFQTMEDTPFYSRSLISYEGVTSGLGTHESLSGKRLRSPIVKAMLPFRMPRL